MKVRKYTCECCHKECTTTRTIEDAMKEKNELFPDEEKIASVCEPCFIKIMDFNEPQSNIGILSG